MEEAATLLEYSYLDNNQGLPPIDFATKQVMAGAPVLQSDSGVLVARRPVLQGKFDSRMVIQNLLVSFIISLFSFSSSFYKCYITIINRGKSLRSWDRGRKECQESRRFSSATYRVL